MSGPITMEIITPRGRFEGRRGLDEVVMRRREVAFEQGSEVAVFPGHGPMLVRIPECDVRYMSEGAARYYHVGPGFVEVYRDHVKLLVPFARRTDAPRRPCG